VSNREDGLIHIKETIKNNPKGMTVTEIANTLGMSRNTVSKYLDMLHISGQVEMRAYGPAKVYSISHRVPINAMLDLASDLILVLDERLEILQANDNTVRFLGVKKEGLIGSRLEKNMTPLFSESTVIDHAREALIGISSSFEIEWSNDNRIYHFKARAIPTTLGIGKSGVTTILEDITQQRIAREALIYSEEKYRVLFENSEYAIVINDDEGHFDCNKAMKRLFATDDTERIKEHLYDTRPPQQPDGRDSLQFMNENIEMVRQGKTVCFDWTLRDFNGHDKPTEITINPITIRGMKMRQSIVRDLTKEKEEQTKILLLSSAMDAAADSIIILDLKGSVIELNDSAMRMLGHRDKREVLGEYWSKKVANPEDAGILKERFTEFLNTGYMNSFTTRVRRQDGNTFPIEVSAAMIKDNSGNPKAIITVSRDISEKAMINELIKKRDRLMHALSSSVIALLESDDPGYGINRMLELIGEATGVSRCYISLLNVGEDGVRSVSVEYGWNQVGIYPSIPDLLHKRMDVKLFRRLLIEITQIGIIQGPNERFTHEEREWLSRMNIRTLLVVPIMIDSELIGVLGFDNCIDETTWSPQEVSILQIGARIAAHFISKESTVPSHPLVAGDPVEGGDRAS
jgi:PAS domain S-box-containing protein